MGVSSVCVEDRERTCVRLSSGTVQSLKCVSVSQRGCVCVCVEDRERTCVRLSVRVSESTWVCLECVSEEEKTVSASV